MHRSHRLKKNEQFQEVFQKGNSAANKQFIVYASRQEGQADFRIGISVSKKIGIAVTRNRVKRLVREVITSLEDKVLPGFDLVLIARPGVEEMTLDAVKGSIEHVLKRAKLLKRNSLQMTDSVKKAES